MAKSNIAREDASVIVDVVRELRGVGVNNHRPTIRACIAVARILAHRNAHARLEDAWFPSACHDVLNVDTLKVTRNGKPLMPLKVEEVIQRVCDRQQKKHPSLEVCKEKE